MTTSATSADVLWTDLHARLRGFIGRRIGDPHAADDVAQDVLLRLHRSLGELRVEDRLDAFAYRIARNAIIDHYRSRASARETPTQPDDLVTRIDAGGDSDQDSDGDGARRELARCLAPLIRQLPEPYREALAHRSRQALPGRGRRSRGPLRTGDEGARAACSRPGARVAHRLLRGGAGQEPAHRGRAAHGAVRLLA